MSPTNARRRQPLRGLDLERRAWALYIDHRSTMREIAARLGVTHSAVVKALHRSEQRALGEVDAMRGLAVAEFQRGRQIAMAAYHASVGEQTRKRTKSRRSAAGDVMEAEILTETQPAGDVCWLTEARHCTEAITRLLGLNTPLRVQEVAPDRPCLDMTEDEVRDEFAKELRLAGLEVTPLTPDPEGHR